MSTVEELKEIIVRLNTAVLRQEDVINELQKENENLRESVDALSAPSQMPAQKPKCLKDSKFDYIIEKALGKHLPPDKSLALSRDEVFAIEDEFWRCENYVRSLELENGTMSKAIKEKENEAGKYKEFYENELLHSSCVKGALEERVKENYELRNKIHALEQELAVYRNAIACRNEGIDNAND